MRILVTLPTDCAEIDEIQWYCWRHERDGIHFCSGHSIVHDGAYYVWRIYCDYHNKYVDWLLMNHPNSLVVY
jgi:hypothetical protein